MINSGIVAFCDSSKLVSQLYDIGWQNGKIGPRRSDMHDDHANAAAVEQGKGSMPLTDTPQGCRPPLDISGQSDELMDLFSIGFAVRVIPFETRPGVSFLTLEFAQSHRGVVASVS